MLCMLAFSLRQREPGQLRSISLVKSLNYMVQSLNHAHYQGGGFPSTVKNVDHTLRTGYATASKARSLQNSWSSKLIRTFCNSYQYYMNIFSAYIVLNLFLVYQLFQFYLFSNLLCFDQTFQSLSQQTNISELQTLHYFMN
jgi:hypothetical protein